jgi:hypothetical protein
MVFVSQFGELYGEDHLVYNVHCLVHIADDVAILGRMDNFSAFPFESFLGKLKRLVRRPNSLLQQLSGGCLRVIKVFVVAPIETYL